MSFRHDKEYRHPFENDPFGVIWEAFRNLWPDAVCTVGWDGSIRDENGEPVAGVTVFEDGAAPHVAVNPSLEVWDATEVLAHELAHVAVGIDEQHGEKWRAAFDAIHAEYDRLVQEEHSDGEMQTKETHGVKLNGGAHDAH